MGCEKHIESLGMETVMIRIQKFFPGLKHGYFNPPKEKFSASGYGR
jgi:hypothetical protein